MNTYFSAFRVDHILGFFRLWELPPHAITGLSGHFNPSSPVSAADLDKLGLWDRQRLSTPYVRAHLLQRRFGRYLRCNGCCSTATQLAFVPALFESNCRRGPYISNELRQQRVGRHLLRPSLRACVA
jgi:hypothetical protein